MAKNLTTEVDKLSAKLETLEHRAPDELAIPYLPHQIPVFECGKKNIVLAKGRRWGGTKGSEHWLLKRALQNPNSRCLWVDVGHRQIIRYLRLYFFTDLKGLPRRSWRWNQQLMMLELSNGSFIDFGSAERPENMEGAAYDYIVVNEAGITLRDEQLYFNSLLPMGSEGAGAEWLFNGTPKGRGVLREVFDRGMDPLETDWASFQLPSHENPIINKDVLERFTRDMPELVYRQEIMAEFLTEGGEFFQEVDKAVQGHELREAAYPDARYVIGLDLGKAHDFTVAWVGDMATRSGVACARFNRLPWPETWQRIKQIAKRFNDARVLVDATGLGSVALDDLDALGVSTEGIVFNNTNKAEILNALAADMEHGRTTFFDHEKTFRELIVFERTLMPSGVSRLAAPPGGHDDCVTALGLMNWGFGRPAMPGDGVFAVPGIGSQFDEEFGHAIN